MKFSNLKSILFLCLSLAFSISLDGQTTILNECQTEDDAATGVDRKNWNNGSTVFHSDGYANDFQIPANTFGSCAKITEVNVTVDLFSIDASGVSPTCIPDANTYVNFYLGCGPYAGPASCATMFLFNENIQPDGIFSISESFICTDLPAASAPYFGDWFSVDIVDLYCPIANIACTGTCPEWNMLVQNGDLIFDYEICVEIIIEDESCTGTGCTAGATDTRACDDGDPTTCNDIETYLVCDDTIICDCVGVADPLDGDCDGVPTTTDCDDTDPLITDTNEDPGTCNTDCTVGDTQVWDSSICSCVTDVVSVYGCMNDITACNYDPLVTCDDGSCIPNTDPGTCNTDCTIGDIEVWNSTTCNCDVQTVTVLGCTVLASCNFDPLANCDDGSCIPNTDPGTCNTDCTVGDTEVWNSTTCSCDLQTVTVLGCTDPFACNYDPAANCNDGSCIPNTDPGTCNTDCTIGDIEVWNSTTCNCDVLTVSVDGCTDPFACNYDPSANCDDGSCIPNTDPGTCNTDCTIGDTEIWNSVTCNCDVLTVSVDGCTDPFACNYDPAATCDDGSCIPNTDPGTCNTDCTLGDIEVWNSVTCNCDVSIVTVSGCTDPASCNYDPLANCDDGSCISNVDPGTCNTDCTLGDIEIWNSVTCNCDVQTVTVLGCTVVASCNYDPLANCDDGSCIPNTDPGTCNTDCSLGDIESWNATTCTCDVTLVTVAGCTDPLACNYDPLATCDDGTCIPNTDPGTCNSDCTLGDVEIWNSVTCSCDIVSVSILGCTNSTADNYDPLANCDDGTCTFPCPDPGTCDDGNCTNGLETWDGANCECVSNPPSEVTGCTDPLYCEYDPLATCDDGSCLTLNTDPGTCNTDCTLGDIESWNPTTCNCDVVTLVIFGCIDANADNFDPAANCDDGSCVYPCPDPGTCDDGNCLNGLETWDGTICDCVSNPPTEITGCTDPTYCEYDPLATCDDGSCLTLNTDPGTCNTDCTLGDIEVWNPITCNCEVTVVITLGCTNPLADNYNPAANCDDGSCDCIPDGCTDPTSCNYNPSATCDDGSCLPQPSCNTDVCVGDTEIVDPNNPCNCVINELQVLGCTDPLSSNFNPAANCDDGSCDCIPDGCTDPAACNFDPSATCDDGSCLPQPSCNTDICLANTEIIDPSDPCGCIVDEIQVLGCTNPLADNYNPLANCDDGSCDCIPDGCIDPTACNYDPLATCDDGSCLPQPNCNTDICIGDTEIVDPTDPCNCLLDVVQVLGCTDPTACNYDPTANCDNNSCLIFDCCDDQLDIGDSCDDGNPDTSNDTVQSDCTCAGQLTFDCPTLMLNFGDPCDDGDPDTVDDVIQPDCSCAGELVPCLDVEVCNTDCTLGDLEEWNPVLCICEVVEEVILGCTDLGADNYDPSANCDDGSCLTSPDIFIPNIISIQTEYPNNEIVVPANPAVTNLSIEVYDRWGNLVNQVIVPELPTEVSLWDGTMNGNLLEQGVYIYVVNYELNGLAKQRIGDITLIR